MNASIEGGRCEGMAVLSQRFTVGLDTPSNYQDGATIVALAQDSVVADAMVDAARSDVTGLVTKKDKTLAASVVVAGMVAGMVAPKTLRRQLGSAMLCASVAQDVAAAKVELTAALDKQAQAVAALKRAK